MKFAIIFLSLALAACGTANVPSHVETVVEKVPVPVQPIKPADVPAVPAPLGPRPPTAQQAADLALAKVCEFVAYALKADPLLRLSAGEPAAGLAKYPECEKH